MRGASLLSRTLVERIAERTARIAVIGQGYVGLPLALLFAEGGFGVLGLDVDPEKVEALNGGDDFGFYGRVRPVSDIRNLVRATWGPRVVRSGLAQMIATRN